MSRNLIACALATAMLTTVSAASVTSNAPVASLDLQRYAGQWHEIAHLPMFFQRQCVDQITATYRANPDGTIAVHNACREPRTAAWLTSWR